MNLNVINNCHNMMNVWNLANDIGIVYSLYFNRKANIDYNL